MLAKAYPEWIDMTQPGDAADRFADLHDSTDADVKKAVLHFAVRGSWPEMSQQVGAMMRVRLCAAADFVESLMFARTPLPRRRSHRDWLRWFLIEAWEHVGFGGIHGSLESLRRDGDTGKLPILSRN